MEKNKLMPPGERRQWAEKLGINQYYLYQCLTGRRDMGPAVARRIESESNGAITRRMVCTRTWFAIWPELAGEANHA